MYQALSLSTHLMLASGYYTLGEPQKQYYWLQQTGNSGSHVTPLAYSLRMWVNSVALQLRPTVEESRRLQRVICYLLQNHNQIHGFARETKQGMNLKSYCISINKQDFY